MTKIVNLTWHDILCVTNESNISIPAIPWLKLQMVSRYDQVWKLFAEWHNATIPVYDYAYSYDQSVIDMIAPQKEGTIYLVSRIVAYIIQRPDFYVTWSHIKVWWQTIWCRWLQKNPYVALSDTVLDS